MIVQALFSLMGVSLLGVVSFVVWEMTDANDPGSALVFGLCFGPMGLAFTVIPWF